MRRHTCEIYYHRKPDICHSQNYRIGCHRKYYLLCRYAIVKHQPSAIQRFGNWFNRYPYCDSAFRV